MFEKFPQLKRLERLLSKAQAFSPKKGKRTPRNGEAESPIDDPPSESEGSEQRTSVLDTHSSFTDSCHHHGGTLKPKAKAETSNFYDSADFVEVQKAEARSKDSRIQSVAAGFRKRTWTTVVSSPRAMSRSKTPKAQAAKDMAKVESCPKTPTSVNTVKIPGRTAFLREMQEAPLSDSLCVLSDEESEEPEDSNAQKPVRFPLPTMPLSIMIPVQDLPDCVIPMDFRTVLSKISRFDSNIGLLMEVRNRLESSYVLYDKLCTSFRGPENLDRFLRSLVARPKRASKEKPKSKAITRPQSAAARPRNYHLNASLPPDFRGSIGSTSRCGSSCSRESRLCRLTVSTKMKQVDCSSTGSRLKHAPTFASSIDTSVSSHHRPASVREYPSRNAMRKNKRTSTNTPSSSIPHVSEEDARQDMLHRVRRGLVNLSWLGRSRRHPTDFRADPRTSVDVSA